MRMGCNISRNAVCIKYYKCTIYHKCTHKWESFVNMNKTNVNLPVKHIETCNHIKTLHVAFRLEPFWREASSNVMHECIITSGTHWYPSLLSRHRIIASLSVTYTCSKRGAIRAVTPPSPAPISSRRPVWGEERLRSTCRANCSRDNTNMQPGSLPYEDVAAHHTNNLEYIQTGARIWGIIAMIECICETNAMSKVRANLGTSGHYSSCATGTGADISHTGSRTQAVGRMRSAPHKFAGRR